MKKLFILLLFFCPTLLFSQPISHIPGLVWNTWHPQQKEMYILGFLAAQQALFYATYGNAVFETRESQDLVARYIYIPDPPQMIIEKVDEFFSDEEKITTFIWAAIYIIYEKNWWQIPEPEPEIEIEPGPYVPAPNFPMG